MARYIVDLERTIVKGFFKDLSPEELKDLDLGVLCINQESCSEPGWETEVLLRSYEFEDDETFDTFLEQILKRSIREASETWIARLDDRMVVNYAMCYRIDLDEEGDEERTTVCALYPYSL